MQKIIYGSAAALALAMGLWAWRKPVKVASPHPLEVTEALPASAPSPQAAAGTPTRTELPPGVEAAAGPSMEQSLDDARQAVETRIAELVQSYGNRIGSQGSQLKCDHFTCSIRLPVDAKDEKLRAELLQKVGMVLVDISKKNLDLVKDASTNNIPADVISLDIEFHVDRADAESENQARDAQKKELGSLLSVEQYQDFLKSNPTMKPMEATVLYILRETQKNGQLGTIQNLRSSCVNEAACRVFVIHEPNTSQAAAENDLIQLIGMVKQAEDILHHGLKLGAMYNVLKNSETWLDLTRVS